MLRYLIVFAVAGGATYALTPLVRKLAVRIGAVVYPDERRVHTAPLPTIGGMAHHLDTLRATQGYENVLTWGKRTLRRAGPQSGWPALRGRQPAPGKHRHLHL